MQEKKKTLSEYEAELARRSREEAIRKRIRRDKKMRFLFASAVVMFSIPVLICLYLILRVNAIDDRIDDLAKSNTAQQAVSETATEYDGEEAVSKGDASLKPEISAGTDMVYLAIAKESDAEADAAREEMPEISDGEDAVTEEAPVISTEATTREIVTNYVPNGKKVYLTFDDGPSINTGKILDILKKNNVKATFFVIYNDDKNFVPYYNRIVDEGHAIGLHSYSHVYDVVYADDAAFREDVTKIHDYVYEVTGVDTKLYRFPGGSSNNVSDNVNTQDMIAYLLDEGYDYIDWNAENGDAENRGYTPEQLNENAMAYIRANEGDSVLLMHDFEYGETTVEALQSLIDTLKAEGYEICPITEDTEPCRHVQPDSLEEVQE